MIVVEFRRPTLDARVYEVAATATVHDDGTVTITGDTSVVPAYTMDGRGLSATANAEAWLARLDTNPTGLFVIPVIVERNGAAVPDPHAAARDAIAQQAARHPRSGQPPVPREREWEHGRPRKHWKTPAHSRAWTSE
jgi:hypothetical protein